MKLQVTLFHNQNKYKPVSTIIDIADQNDLVNNKGKVLTRAINNIAHKRYMSPNEVVKLGYTKFKTRIIEGN